MATAYVGEIGFPIQLPTGTQLDVSETHTIIVKKPSGAEVEWVATIFDTTYVQYLTAAIGDLDESGMYTLQHKKVAGSTVRYGSVYTQKVRALHERGI